MLTILPVPYDLCIFIALTHHGINVCLAYLDSVLNVKVLVGAFNQEKALEGAFYMNLKSSQTFM